MSCILRISGESLNVDALLSQCDMVPDRTWKKGETRSQKGKIYSDSGANFIASEADFDEFTLQLTEATTYLETHASTIVKMVAIPGVQFAVLDFGVCLREENVALFCYFPPQFIQLATSAGIGLEVSQYACSEDGSES